MLLGCYESSFLFSVIFNMLKELMKLVLHLLNYVFSKTCKKRLQPEISVQRYLMFLFLTMRKVK